VLPKGWFNLAGRNRRQAAAAGAHGLALGSGALDSTSASCCGRRSPPADIFVAFRWPLVSQCARRCVRFTSLEADIPPGRTICSLARKKILRHSHRVEMLRVTRVRHAVVRHRYQRAPGEFFLPGEFRAHSPPPCAAKTGRFVGTAGSADWFATIAVPGSAKR